MWFRVRGVHGRPSSIVQRIAARVKGMPVTDQNNILSRLMGVIEDRKANPPEQSYTTKLFNGGTATIGDKILEEAAEVVEAADEAGDEGRAHLIYEAADLLFHLMVMLGFKDIHIHEVEAELSRRFGISGIDEKAARQ